MQVVRGGSRKDACRTEGRDKESRMPVSMNKADLEELPGDTEDALEIDVAARVEEVFDSVMEQKS